MSRTFRSLSLALLCAVGLTQVQAQVTTNSGSGLAATYPSLAAAITALNAATITGPVTIDLTAGNPQTAPAGGYSITAQGTATNTITITGNSNTITAGVGTATTTDAFFKLIGADYVTLQGFVMQESAGNTTNTTKIEWGVALLHASTTNGAQNNTIQNNSITLDKTNPNSIGIYSNNSHSATAVGTAESVTNNTTGPAIGNKFYSNTISNVNLGITLIGTPTSANQDSGNDIGGSSSSTGNTITNWGGVSTSSYNANSGTIYCIYLNHQQGVNCSYNTLTSATMSATGQVRGIFLNYGTAPSAGSFTNTINNNTVTVTNTGAASAFEMIRHAGLGTTLSGVTINVNNNTLLNCSSAGEFIGVVVANSASGTTNVNGNIIRGTAQSSTTSAFTGISVAGAVVNAININNNQIGNASGNAVTFSAANSSAVTGITNTGGASTCALTMTGNDFRGFVHSVAGSSAHSYIVNTAATLSQNISTNTFTNLNVNTTGNVRFISNDVALSATGTVTASGNSIVTAFNKGGAGGTVFLYYTTTSPSSAVGSTKTEQNNNFSNITLTGATTMSGWADLEGATGGGSNKTISNNTFSNWTCGTSAVTVLQTNYGGNNTAVSNNTITNISTPSASGASIIGISIGSSNGGAAQTCAGNTISGLSAGTLGSVTGITGNTTATTMTYSGNAIIGLSSTNTTGTVTGIQITGGGTTTNVTGNTINTLSSTGTSTSVVNGIAISGGATVNISRNKVYDLAQSSTSTSAPGVNGILLSGGTAVNTFNNLIGDLRAPAMNVTDAIRGISVTSTAASTTFNLSFNTVYLNGTSSGANFGTTGIYHTTNATATTATLNLRSNIIVNTSTPNGTGLTVAYRRSSSTLTNYGSSSNNNLFYAGVPGASRLIFNDGTNSDQNLAAYKARVSTRDAASVTENPPFLSTTGSSSNFLHIDPATATAIESGGLTVSGITTDFDGDTRNVTTPDIGADEGMFTVPSGCSGTPVGGTSSATGGSNACVGGTKSLNNTGATSGPGITYQWQVSTTSGSGYVDVTGGTGANTTSYTTGALAAGTYYYVLQVKCGNTAPPNDVALSTEVTITVNPLPTVLVNGVAAATGTYCSPGGTAVSLTASGASTYAWSPAGGLSATTGASVTASPSATTTYTVTGTDGNGCVNTATAAITVASAPTGVSATATPGTICSGSTANLSAAGSVPTSASAYAPSPSSGSFNPLSGATTVSAVKTDDGISGALPIGFTFNYAGGSYTNVYASSNGFLSFNASAANTATNNLATPASTVLPLVAPLWDDLDGTSAGTASYLTTGTAPNRVFTFEWLNWEWNYQANAAVISFQVKLYESNGQIEFIYRQDAAAYNAGSTGGASIGLAGSTSGNFLSLTNTTGAPGTSTSTETSNLTSKPATGQVYAFLPAQPTYSWAPAGLVVNPTAQSTATTALTATQLYTVTVSNGSCSTAANATVTVNPLTCGALTTSGTACPGLQTVTANPSGGGTPYSYAWTEDGLPFGGNTASITASVGTHTYVCTVTDACSNSCSSSLVVTTNALSAVSIAPTPANAVICGTGSVALDATGASTYAWSPATSLSATTGASVTSTTTGTVTYTVTGTDANGCVNTASVTVRALANPTISSVTATPASVCSGANSQLQANAASTNSVASAYTFVASQGTFTALVGGTAIPAIQVDNAVSTGIPIGFSFPYAGGTYTNAYPAANGFLSFNSGANNLAGNNLSSTGNGNRPILAPLWDDLDGTSGTASYLTTGSAGSRVFTCEWLNWEWNTSANTAVISFQVKLYEADGHIEFLYRPEAGAVNNGTSGASIGLAGTVNGNFLSLTSSGASPGINSVTETTNISTKPATGQVYAFYPQAPLAYSWSPNTFLSATNIADPVATAVTADQAYTVTVSQNGCSATGNVSVVVTPALTAGNITGTLSYCAGGSTTLTAVATGGANYTYAWTGPSGPAGTAATQVANAPGSWSVDITSCGVTQTASVTVVENPLPTPTINPAGTVNFCVSGTLTASTASSYLWSPGGATTPSITATTDGSYTVQVTDANGCVATSPATVVTISAQPSAVSIAPPTPAAICEGGSVGLSATGGTYPASLLLNAGSITIPGTGTGATSGSPANPYPSTITVSGLPASGVTVASVSLNGFAHAFPNDVDMVLQSPTGTNVIIMADAGGTNAVTARNWVFSDAAATTLPAAGASGTYKPTSGDGTADLFPAPGPTSINQTSPTLSSFSGNPNGVWNLYVTDDASGDAGSLTGWSITFNYAAQSPFTWNPGTGLNTTSGPTVTASPSAPGQSYTVTATNGACTSQASVNVVVNPLPTVTCPANIAGICTLTPAFALTGGSPAGGVYSGTGVSGGQFDPAVSGDGLFTITYAYTDGNTCSSNCTFTIDVDAAPTWYLDSDGDGEGDVNASTEACTAPPGYVASPGDFCPGDPLKLYPGACGCGSPDVDTDGDSYLDCVDACPNDPNKIAAGSCGCGNPEPGMACNDNNANTINDVVNSSCQCIGTPVLPCANSLVLDLQTDGNGAQTSWSISPAGGGSPLYQGSGYASNALFSIANLCLPNGSYVFKVMDSAGNGIASPGGFVLRMADGRKVLDNTNNGGFTSVSSVTEGFTLPLGALQVEGSNCDRTDFLPNEVIRTIPSSAVSAQFGVTNSTSGYEWWFHNPNGGYSRKVVVTHASAGASFPAGPERCTYFRLNGLATNPLPYNVLLNARVRPLVNNVFGSYGPACRVKIDNQTTSCVITQLIGTPGNTFSCGATGKVVKGSGYAGRIYAQPAVRVVNGANQTANYYIFEFQEQSTGYYREMPNPGYTLVLGQWYTTPLLCGTYTYDVKVKASFDGGLTFCPYGPSCTVTITNNLAAPYCTSPSAPLAGSGGRIMDEETTAGSDLVVWPNPNRGDQVNLTVDQLDLALTTATLDLYDLFGKKVASYTLPVRDGLLSSTLDLRGDLATGMYLVTVTAGDKVFQQRLVIE